MQLSSPGGVDALSELLPSATHWGRFAAQCSSGGTCTSIPIGQLLLALGAVTVWVVAVHLVVHFVLKMLTKLGGGGRE